MKSRELLAEEKLFSSINDVEKMKEAIAAIKLLQSQNIEATIDPRNYYGATPLIEAAHIGNFGVVNALIEAGANKNAVSQSGSSALIVAVWGNHTQVAIRLIDAGTNLNIRRYPKYGRETALHIAWREKNLEVFRHLLVKGIDKEIGQDCFANILYSRYFRRIQLDYLATLLEFNVKLSDQLFQRLITYELAVKDNYSLNISNEPAMADDPRLQYCLGVYYEQNSQPEKAMPYYEKSANSFQPAADRLTALIAQPAPQTTSALRA